MRHFPFYAYPNFPHSFYASPAEANSFHRPHRQFSTPASSPAAPAPTPRSVINVPVFDSEPSQASFSPSQPPLAAVKLIDPSAAATTIQSHFRGFCVRRHRPLLHLCTIATARKRLEDLQSELGRPEFSSKVTASEKERLQFNEAVMAIILRLDAIEGSMAEVRSQRKEATKMAIKLQDAIDAIVMQKEEIAALDPAANDGNIAPNQGIAPSKDSALLDQPQNPLCPDSDMVQEETYAVSRNGIVDVMGLEEKHLSPEDDGANKHTPSHASNNLLASEDVSPLHPCLEDLDQQGEAGLGYVEPRIQCAKTASNAEQDLSYVLGENATSDAPHAAEEEGKNCTDALHVKTRENHVKNDAKVNQDSDVGDMVDAGAGASEKQCFDGSNECKDVSQEGKKGMDEDVGICIGTPTAEEKCDYDVTHGNELQGSSSLDRLTDGKCSADGHGFATSHHRDGYEERSDDAQEGSSSNEVKAQTCPASMEKASSTPQDNAILSQLSEDCRQLKSLVGKLLLQNKAQSNILCALAERLETLEHQKQRTRRHDRQKSLREKRKLAKGSKRSMKCRSWECYL